MQYHRLLDDICTDEGYRAHPYLDTVGVWTIGYGTTYINGEPVTEDTPRMSRAVAMDILKSDIFSACMDAQQVIPNFDDLNDVRQEVLVNMAYNLGGRGLARFLRMKAAIEQRDFAAAAAEMKDSTWYSQVGNRATRLEARMLSGLPSSI